VSHKARSPGAIDCWAMKHMHKFLTTFSQSKLETADFLHNTFHFRLKLNTKQKEIDWVPNILIMNTLPASMHYGDTIGYSKSSSKTSCVTELLPTA